MLAASYHIVGAFQGWCSSVNLVRDPFNGSGNRLISQRQPILFPLEFAMFLLFTTVVIAAGLVTIDLLTEVRA